MCADYFIPEVIMKDAAQNGLKVIYKDYSDNKEAKKVEYEDTDDPFNTVYLFRTKCFYQFPELFPAIVSYHDPDVLINIVTSMRGATCLDGCSATKFATIYAGYLERLKIAATMLDDGKELQDIQEYTALDLWGILQADQLRYIARVDVLLGHEVMKRFPGINRTYVDAGSDVYKRIHKFKEWPRYVDALQLHNEAFDNLPRRCVTAQNRYIPGGIAFCSNDPDELESIKKQVDAAFMTFGGDNASYTEIMDDFLSMNAHSPHMVIHDRDKFVELANMMQAVEKCRDCFPLAQATMEGSYEEKLVMVNGDKDYSKFQYNSYIGIEDVIQMSFIRDAIEAARK
jgi:hypothetical protein